MIRDKRGIYILLFLYFIIFLFAYRKLFPIGMIAKGDSNPIAQTPRDMFITFFYLWKPLVKGGPVPYYIYNFFQGVISVLCIGNTVLAKKIFMFLPIPLACFGMYFLSGRIARKRVVRFLTSLIYGLCPPAIGTFLGGAELMLYGHAILPFAVYSFLKLRKSLIFGKGHISIYYRLLIFAVLSSLLYSASKHNVLFLLGMILYLFLELIVKMEYKRISLSVFIFFLWGILLFALTAHYTYTSMKTLLRFSGMNSNLQQDGETLLYLIATVKGCFGIGGMANTIRLIPQHFSFLAKVDYWELVGFSYPMLAFTPFLFKQIRFKKYVVLASFGALGIISFIWFTKLGWLVNFLHIRLPFLFNFQNPSRLVMWQSFFYAILAAIALEEICDFFHSRQKKYLAFATYGLVAIAISIYSWPVFLGDMGLSRGRVRYRTEGKIDIPKVFYKATDWLNSHGLQEGTFRTLWYPSDFEPTQISLTWLDPYWFNVPFGAELYKIGGVDFVKNINMNIVNNDEKMLSNLLKLANVKYIIVNLTSLQRGCIQIKGQYLQGSPVEFIRIFEKKGFLQLVEDNKDFKIYYNTRL